MNKLTEAELLVLQILSNGPVGYFHLSGIAFFARRVMGTEDAIPFAPSPHGVPESVAIAEAILSLLGKKMITIKRENHEPSDAESGVSPAHEQSGRLRGEGQGELLRLSEEAEADAGHPQGILPLRRLSAENPSEGGEVEQPELPYQGRA